MFHTRQMVRRCFGPSLKLLTTNWLRECTDPLFFLLHSQLDRIWAAWQAFNSKNRYAIGGGVDQDLSNFDAHPAGTGTPVTKDTVLYMSNLGPDAKVEDILDIQGGLLCYEYDN